MAAPLVPVLFPLPTNGGRDKTYPELLRSMSCTCPAGAILKPSIPPIPGFNLGDIIADQSKLLSAFAAGYSMLTVVMKVIMCIIDVICALTNPFAVIAAVIRLFGECLPDLILLLPQLAIPAMILCLIKIILAIITYILVVIIPLIQDIIQNIQNLMTAINTGNQHAIKAVAFKIVSLIKELYNVLGILAALDAILAMVKALIGLGIGIPCGGKGGSCGGCGDTQCPPVFDNFTLTGIDGQLTIIPMFGGSTIGYLIYFSSVERQEDFLSLYDFFPTGVDYNAITDQKKLPYSLYCDGYYAVTSVDEEGVLSLAKIPGKQNSDGYLSSIYNNNGVPTAVDSLDEYARFGVSTPQFLVDDANGTTYIELSDSDGIGAVKNSGTFMITSVYDAYNVKLNHVDQHAWSIQASYYPTSGLGTRIVWRKIAVSQSNGSLPFTFNIHHEELIRRSMIGVGCHPDVKAAVHGAKNRNPYLDIPIPTLPDIDGSIAAATACISAIAPIDVDSQYVIDNYGSIAQAAAVAGVCVTDALSTLGNNMVSYASTIYPRIFSQDKSLLSSNRSVQVIGADIIISIIPMDINGSRLASDLPPGIMDVKAFTTFGELLPVTEIIDAYGTSTGEFQTLLTSNTAGGAQVTASVAGIFISNFDTTLATPNYVARKLSLAFVDSRPADKKPQDSTEPLGIAGTGGTR